MPGYGVQCYSRLATQGDFHRQNLLRDFIGRCYIPGGDAGAHKAGGGAFIDSGFPEVLGFRCFGVSTNNGSDTRLEALWV